jgi:hypothetical protein
MIIYVETGPGAPTLTLARKGERGPAGIGARESITRMRPDEVDGLSTRQGLLPLPLAGEDRGRGHRGEKYITAGAAQ